MKNPVYFVISHEKTKLCNHLIFMVLDSFDIAMS